MSKNGMVLYDIQMDGCLTGVYTNEPADGIVYNEIARKKKEWIKETDSSERWDIEGEYDCMWFDLGNDRIQGILKITRKAGASRVFTVQWFDDSGNIKFTGTGYVINPRQFSVRYE